MTMHICWQEVAVLLALIPGLPYAWSICKRCVTFIKEQFNARRDDDPDDDDPLAPGGRYRERDAGYECGCPHAARSGAAQGVRGASGTADGRGVHRGVQRGGAAAGGPVDQPVQPQRPEDPQRQRRLKLVN